MYGKTDVHIYMVDSSSWFSGMALSLFLLLFTFTTQLPSSHTHSVCTILHLSYTYTYATCTYTYGTRYIQTCPHVGPIPLSSTICHPYTLRSINVEPFIFGALLQAAALMRGRMNTGGVIVKADKHSIRCMHANT